MTRTLKAILLGVLLPLSRPCGGQAYKSQIEHPIARYKMSARLDPAIKTVKGYYTVTWWNHTEDSIPDLHFHLYLNAFKNRDSTLMREMADAYYRDQFDRWIVQPGSQKWGWVDVDKIQIVGGADLTRAMTFVHPDDDNASDQTVMKVVLPQPIPPHGTIDLTVEFTARLPRSLLRTGYDVDYFLVAQWFPKIGVYEAPGERGRKQGGWNCHQFHVNTEFYADYGVYDVELTVPSNYIVGSTGFRRSERPNPDGTKTYNYYQEDVHDFAWTASPHFIELKRPFKWRELVSESELTHWSRVFHLPLDLIALRDVSVTLLLEPDHRHLADRHFRAIFNGLKYYGLWYGQYPYDTLTVVDPQRNSNTGGQEYPTFVTAGTPFWPGEHAFSPEMVTIHEFGHNFWYGLVGNNEFEEPWLDEGLNTYSTSKVLATAYGNNCGYVGVSGIPILALPWLSVKTPSFPFAGVSEIPMGPYFSCVPDPTYTIYSDNRKYYLEHASEDDLVRNGWQYLDGPSYEVNSYTRVALTLRTLENYLGSETMARVMRTYQGRWRFRHPITRDFIDTVDEVAGQNMDWFFEQLFYNSTLADYAVTEITNKPLEGQVGIYDEGGRKKAYRRNDAMRAFKQGRNERYRSTVLVRRLGEAIAPVDVLIRFENGETVRDRWDGKYRWARYIFEKPIKVESAEVDPQRKLMLDANFTNNSRLASEDNRGAAKWYVRWIFWLENLYFVASFFS